LIRVPAARLWTPEQWDAFCAFGDFLEICYFCVDFPKMAEYHSVKLKDLAKGIPARGVC
jgi:hypothetical protein